MHVINTFIFHILLSLRGVILNISKLFSLFFLCGFVIVIYLSSQQTIPIAAKIMTLTLGIIFTMIYWFYDDLVFLFTPENTDLRLYK